MMAVFLRITELHPARTFTRIWDVLVGFDAISCMWRNTRELKSHMKSIVVMCLFRPTGPRFLFHAAIFTLKKVATIMRNVALFMTMSLKE